MKYTFLSGGTGTPKLLQGFRELIPDSDLGIICNTGDDLYWYNLLVCPDLDTILYLFSNRLDTDKFWGVKDETFHSLETLKSLNEETWFNIGDKDLGLHLLRDKLLESMNLTEVTERISDEWGINAKIYPMSNHPLRSLIETSEGNLPFQEYFVKYKWQLTPKSVSFEGQKEEIPHQVEDLLKNSESLILGPSNPATSIGPIFSLNPISDFFGKNKDKVIAISPIEGDQAYSGPSIALMKAIGIEPNVVGLAEHYKDHISKLIISNADRDKIDEIRDFDIEPIVLPIELQTQKQKINLARSLVEIL